LIGDASPEVVSAVRNELTADVSFFRSTAVRTLCVLVPESEETLPAAISLLDDVDRSVRLNAALAIADLPGDRRDAIRLLTAMLTDDSHYVCTGAVIALCEIGPDARSAVPMLRKLEADPQGWVLNRRRRMPPELSFAIAHSPK